MQVPWMPTPASALSSQGTENSSSALEELEMMSLAAGVADEPLDAQQVLEWIREGRKLGEPVHCC